jgi:hypothetical protein
MPRAKNKFFNECVNVPLSRGGESLSWQKIWQKEENEYLFSYA